MKEGSLQRLAEGPVLGDGGHLRELGKLPDEERARRSTGGRAMSACECYQPDARDSRKAERGR